MLGKRNILLKPGPSTTTDSVKMAQIVPDICPRESEFVKLMGGLREELVKVVHGAVEEYTAVPFCGSGTINIDICLNSLLPEGKKVLVINNGAYSARAVEVCEYYGLPHINLTFPFDQLPDLEVVEKVLCENPDIALRTPDPESLQRVQSAILENCARYVKAGGHLYYSTCSLLQDENDDIVGAFLKKHSEFAAEETDSSLDSMKTQFGLQFLPDTAYGAGFYVCKMRKTV